MLRRLCAVFVVLSAVLGLILAHGSSSARAATCADYPNQAAAQAAGDTRDADGDGIYCESSPCPCSTAAPTRTLAPTPAPAPIPDPTPVPSGGTPALSTRPATAVDTTDPANCMTPKSVQNITFSKSKYPNIRKHFLRALRKGWPRTLVLNRDGADDRRARLLEGVATKAGYDRDEYPPALARGKGAGLTKGIDRRGWRADVALLPSHENRSHGSTMGPQAAGVLQQHEVPLRLLLARSRRPRVAVRVELVRRSSPGPGPRRISGRNVRARYPLGRLGGTASCTSGDLVRQ